jgi:hypothetical protein
MASVIGPVGGAFYMYLGLGTSIIEVAKDGEFS